MKHPLINQNLVFILIAIFFFSLPLKAKANPFEISDTRFVYSAAYQGMNLGKIHISFEKKNQADELKNNNFPYPIEGIEDFYYYSLVFHPEGMADFFVDFWRSEHWLGLYQQKLVNLSYFAEYQGFFRDRKIDVVSDLINQTNLNQDTRQLFDAPFPNLNNFTVFLALAFDLLKNPNISENQSMIYNTSRDDESRQREFIHRNQSTVETAVGDFFTEVFELNEKRYQTQLFVSKEFSYLPVQILSQGSRGSIEIKLVEMLSN